MILFNVYDKADNKKMWNGNIFNNMKKYYMVYTSKENNYQFSSKKPSVTKHSPQYNVYYIELNRK